MGIYTVVYLKFTQTWSNQLLLSRPNEYFYLILLASQKIESLSKKKTNFPQNFGNVIGIYFKSDTVTLHFSVCDARKVKV